MRLVYFSPLPWNSFSQRSHEFVEWFHSRGEEEILWIDPYPTRLPELNDFRRVKKTRLVSEIKSSSKDVPEWLTVLNPKSLPIEPLLGSGYINRLLWNDTQQKVNDFIEKDECLLCIAKPSELALQVLEKNPKVFSLYDAMDDFPAFYGGISKQAMARRERKVASKVSQLFVSSTMLAERFAIHQSKLTLVLNACAANLLPPVVNASKQGGKLVLGYVGTIGHWFDWALVFSIARTNPSVTIRLIGPVYVLPKEAMPTNIELLPACDHAIAIQAMQEFSIGLIPFKCTELTASVDPIKYYEYRALGLPIISSHFGEMALRGDLDGVFLVDNNSDLKNQIENVATFHFEKFDVQKFRIENSWHARFNKSGILAPV